MKLSKGIILNKIIKKLLKKLLGISRKDVDERLDEFKQFSGCWSKEDLDEFNKSIAQMNEVDELRVIDLK